MNEYLPIDSGGWQRTVFVHYLIAIMLFMDYYFVLIAKSSTAVVDNDITYVVSIAFHQVTTYSDRPVLY